MERVEGSPYGKGKAVHGTDGGEIKQGADLQTPH